MSSQRRIRASRANGKRSRGPKTPEGKQRSAANAIRHGLLAQCVVLETESAPNFQLLLSEHIRKFAPADDVELGFIEEMAASRWRLRRLWAIETSLLDQTVVTEEHEDPVARIANAFSKLAAGPQLSLLLRYEARLHRVYNRALQNIAAVQKMDLPNEPNPISGHSAPPPDPVPPPPAGDPAPPSPEPCPTPFGIPSAPPAATPAPPAKPGSAPADELPWKSYLLDILP